MIVRFFNKSYLPQYLLLVILSMALWGGAFFSPPTPARDADPYLSPGYMFLQALFGGNALLYAGVAFLLVMGSALLFNFTLEKNGLSATNSLVPAFTFILLMSLFPSLQTLHQALIPGVLIIVVLYYVFEIYTEVEAYPKVFNSGFFIALGSFFYFPSIAFVLFIWFTFVVYRLFKWREWIILLFGFFTPYILLWTWYFWNDELAAAFRSYAWYFRPKFAVTFGAGLNVLNYVSLGLAGILFIRGLATQALAMQENVIAVRKRFWSVMMFFAVSLLSFLFSGGLATYHVVFVQIAFTLIIQGLTINKRRWFVTELLVLLLVVSVLLNNYYVAFLSSIN